MTGNSRPRRSDEVDPLGRVDAGQSARARVIDVPRSDAVRRGRGADQRDHDATRASLAGPVIETSDRTKPRQETAARTPSRRPRGRGDAARCRQRIAEVHPGRLRTPLSPLRAPIEPTSWPASPASPHRPQAAARRSFRAVAARAYRNVQSSLRRSTRTWSASVGGRGASTTRGTRSPRWPRWMGVVADTLHVAMHGPDGDLMDEDEHTALPWPALCAEVAKVGSASARASSWSCPGHWRSRRSRQPRSSLHSSYRFKNPRGGRRNLGAPCTLLPAQEPSRRSRQPRSSLHSSYRVQEPSETTSKGGGADAT